MRAAPGHTAHSAHAHRGRAHRVSEPPEGRGRSAAVTSGPQTAPRGRGRRRAEKKVDAPPSFEVPARSRGHTEDEPRVRQPALGWPRACRPGLSRGEPWALSRARGRGMRTGRCVAVFFSCSARLSRPTQNSPRRPRSWSPATRSGCTGRRPRGRRRGALRVRGFGARGVSQSGHVTVCLPLRKEARSLLNPHPHATTHRGWPC